MSRYTHGTTDSKVRVALYGREIDDDGYCLYGMTAGQREAMYEAVVALVRARLAKAQRVEERMERKSTLTGGPASTLSEGGIPPTGSVSPDGGPRSTASRSAETFGGFIQDQPVFGLRALPAADARIVNSAIRLLHAACGGGYARLCCRSCSDGT